MATNSLIEGELFHKITRDERQEECRRKWIKNRCVGTIVASTGFGTVKAGHIPVNYNAVLFRNGQNYHRAKSVKAL